MREVIHLECNGCKERNYTSAKNKHLHTNRVEYKKYCPSCRKHTLHKETR